MNTDSENKELVRFRNRLAGLGFVRDGDHSFHRHVNGHEVRLEFEGGEDGIVCAIFPSLDFGEGCEYQSTGVMEALVFACISFYESWMKYKRKGHRVNEFICGKGHSVTLETIRLFGEYGLDGHDSDDAMGGRNLSATREEGD